MSQATQKSEALDRKLATLREHAAAWTRLPIDDKAQLIDGLLQGIVRVAERQVSAALRAKGWSNERYAAEELIAGPVVTARNLRLLGRSLKQIARQGAPQLPSGAVRARADGQVTVRVVPSDWSDRVLYRGISADVWLDSGVTPEQLPQIIATSYRQPDRQPRVCLVLGAGNVASIAPLDVAYKLFVEGAVCLLKMNPVNEYLGPFLEEAFDPLIRAGFVQITYGGAEVGEHLCQHEGVDEIHITGSAATHDAIVYGGGAEGERRKRRDEPINIKPVTSELGNVGPVIIAPGDWSRTELRFQAENIATQLVNNAGFNCNAARVLITHADWAQRGAFLDELRALLRRLPSRPAYYPGAAQRYQAVANTHPQLEQFGDDAAGALPWGLVLGVDAQKRDEVCFTRESFCGVLAETSLEAAHAGDFLQRAASWCNEMLWGTLNAAIVIDPQAAQRHAGELDRAVATLRYGSVAINHWPALSYGLGTTTWGAFPGHTRRDIQSGVGVVHNAYMLERVQKTVVRGPFTISPRPLWFATHRNPLPLARRLLRFEIQPSPVLLPGLLLASLRG